MSPHVRLKFVVLTFCLALSGPVTVLAQQSPAPGTTTAQAQAPTGPGQQQTDRDLAERALERTLVGTGALLLTAGQLEIEPSLFYFRTEQRGPGTFTTNGTTFVAEQRLNRNIVNAGVEFRLGLPFEMQAELDLPFGYTVEERVTEVGFVPRADTRASASGIGDVQIGIAKTLFVESGARPSLVARLTWDTDSGKTNKSEGVSVGTGFDEARVSLVGTNRQDPLVFLGGLSYEKSFKKDGVEPGDRVGLSIGAALAASPQTSLRAVLNQIFVRESRVQGSTVGGSDTVIGVLTLGASSIVGAGKFLDFTIQTGLTDAAPKFGVGISLTIRTDMWRR
jgi:hypothetical protein